MNINTLIFDLDGVIVDTARFHFLAWNKLANTWNHTITHEQNEELKGINRMRSLELIAGWCNVKLNDDEKKEYAELKNNWYLEQVKQMTESDTLPGVKNLLTEAKNNNIKIAVASASKNANEVLRNINLIQEFDYIADGNSVKESKPNPAVFLNVAQHLKVNPAQCIVFEDAPAGVEAALAGGFHVVGIGNKQSLPNAHFILAGFENISLNDILNFFK